MLPATELTGHVGHVGYVCLPGAGVLRMNVRILDARERFGSIDYLVTPMSGDGQAWYEGRRVHFLSEQLDIGLLNRHTGDGQL